MTDADGEQQENQHWIEIAADCGYLTSPQASDFQQACAEVGRMLGSMISQAEHFCRPEALRESRADYCTEALNTDSLNTDLPNTDLLNPDP